MRVLIAGESMHSVVGALLAADPQVEVVGDRDGVVVVPKAQAEAVAAQLEVVKKKEADTEAKVLSPAGKTMSFWSEDSATETVIMVTHDIDEAIYLSDRIVVMNEGRMMQDADPETLFSRPADRQLCSHHASR